MKNLILLSTLSALVRGQPVYVTVAGHLEDLQRYKDCSTYPVWRSKLLAFADMVKLRGLKFNLQVSYEFLKGAMDCETTQMKATTSGKNVIDYLATEFPFEIDTHQEGASTSDAHSGNNFADITYIGRQVSPLLTNTTGFLWDDASLYQSFQSGEVGKLHPSFTWKPNILAGGVSSLHTNGNFMQDMSSLGVWIPKGFGSWETFHTVDDSATARMVYIGSGPQQYIADWGSENNCHFRDTGDFLKVLTKYIQDGTFSANEMYTTTFFVPQSIITDPTRHIEFETILDGIDALVAESKVQYVHFTEAANTWRQSFNSRPNIIKYDQFREQDRTCPPPSPTPPLNPSSPTPPTQGACGDGTCQTKETPLNCPADCADSTPASKSTYEFLVVDGKSLEMDLYSPPSSADSGSSPAVVLIHGGAFRAGDKQQLSAWGEHLSSQGFFAASINYRLTPDFPSGQQVFPLPLQDCKCAVRYLRSRASDLKLDPRRIYVIGGSAGGTFASLLGTTSNAPELEPASCGASTSSQDSSVAGVVDYYGITDFRTLWKDRSDSAIASADDPPIEALFTGSSCIQAPETDPLCAAASAVHYLDPGDPPFFLLHSNDDGAIPVAQTNSFFSSMASSQHPVQRKLLDGQGHGWISKFEAPDVQAARDEVTQWLTDLSKTLPQDPPTPEKVSSAHRLGALPAGGHFSNSHNLLLAATCYALPILIRFAAGQ